MNFRIPFLGRKKKRRVLVIDDDAFILLAVEKFLTIKGCEVVSMQEPEKAYAYAGEQKPDLIISDLSMPGVDGFTLLRCFRQNKSTSKIPVMMLTASDRGGDVEKGFGSGAAAYILKPIDWDRFWAKVEPFLAGG